MDSESLPLTEPYKPAFDTGAHPRAEPAFIEPAPPARRHRWWHRRSDTSPTEIADEPASSPAPAAPIATSDAPPSESPHAASITVPGRYHHVKWWQFIPVLLAVWVPAAAIGAGLFYWWSHDNSKDKTAVVFVVLVYIVVCTVTGLMLAMVPDRPLLSALAIAMISAVFASVVAAAPLYGAFYCDHSQHRCLVGIVPY